MKNAAVKTAAGFSLSKKSSLCWAFSIIHGIMVMGDEECYKVGKWNEAYLKSWTPKVWCPRNTCCEKSMLR